MKFSAKNPAHRQYAARWHSFYKDMDLDNFIRQLDKIQQNNPDFKYRLGRSLEQSDIKSVEDKLGVQIPDKTKMFLTTVNGLRTVNPEFDLIDIATWESKNGFIQFATFDKDQYVCFDTKKLNEAGEWTIVHKDSGYVLTLTMSSFWSNKIWHWLKQRHKIWADNWWTEKNEC